MAVDAVHRDAGRRAEQRAVGRLVLLVADRIADVGEKRARVGERIISVGCDREQRAFAVSPELCERKQECGARKRALHRPQRTWRQNDAIIIHIVALKICILFFKQKSDFTRREKFDDLHRAEPRRTDRNVRVNKLVFPLLSDAADWSSKFEERRRSPDRQIFGKNSL